MKRFFFLMSIVLCRLAAFHAVVYMRYKKVVNCLRFWVQLQHSFEKKKKLEDSFPTRWAGGKNEKALRWVTKCEHHILGMTARVVTSTRGSSVWLTPCCGSIQRAAKKRARKRGRKGAQKRDPHLILWQSLPVANFLTYLLYLVGMKGSATLKRTHSISQDCFFYINIKACRTQNRIEQNRIKQNRIEYVLKACRTCLSLQALKGVIKEP